MTKCDFCTESFIRNGVLECTKNRPDYYYCKMAIEKYQEAIIKDSSKEEKK